MRGVRARIQMWLGNVSELFVRICGVGYRIYHCNGTTWERWSSSIITGTDATTGYNWVGLANVTSFSPFAIGGGPGAPTHVTLSNFTARSEEDRTALALALGAFGVVILGALAIVFVRRA